MKESIMKNDAEDMAFAIYERECKLNPAVMKHTEYDENARLWYLSLADAALWSLICPSYNVLRTAYANCYRMDTDLGITAALEDWERAIRAARPDECPHRNNM